MKTHKLAGRAFLCALLLIGGTRARAAVIYVNAAAAGTHNGTSWATAYADLRAAIAAAHANDEIWVAGGTYKPTAGTDRTIYFELKSNVRYYAGFAGTETARSQRDTLAHETILSGEIGTPAQTDNSYSVVIGAAGVVLDGFTITGGYDPQSSGGGIYMDSVSPTIVGCWFHDNVAGYGAGVFIYGPGTPKFTGCIFTSNHSFAGGGVYNYGASPILTDCYFGLNTSASSNTSGYSHGAGIYNDGGSSSVVDCTFSGNTAADDGAGIYNLDSTAKISGCTFVQNQADFGVAIFNDGPEAVSITGCTFDRNSSPTGTGGAIYHNKTVATVSNCSFTGNYAGNAGGAIFNFDCPAKAFNCTFTGNSSRSGGAISSDLGTPAATNCTFINNSAVNVGGAVDTYIATIVATNCILWGNTAPTGPQAYRHGATGTSTFRNCDIAGCNGSGVGVWTTVLGTDGGGNIDADPRLIDAANPAGPDARWRTFDDGLALLPDSPCIDAGTAANAPGYDIRAYYRPVDGNADHLARFDMGAYEFQTLGPPPAPNAAENWALYL